jgi:uncharacterized protein YlzI (FlbEa/FlbD family)
MNMITLTLDNGTIAHLNPETIKWLYKNGDFTTLRLTENEYLHTKLSIDEVLQLIAGEAQTKSRYSVG